MNQLCLLALSFFIMTASASASEVPIQGEGTATGFCQETFGQLCMNQIQQQAEEQARQQATENCQAQQGTAGYLSCSTNCNPPFLPPGPGHLNQFVSCSSGCDGECQIP
jgi:hypothetical protein